MVNAIAQIILAELVVTICIANTIPDPTAWAALCTIVGGTCVFRRLTDLLAVVARGAPESVCTCPARRSSTSALAAAIHAVAIHTTRSGAQRTANDLTVPPGLPIFSHGVAITLQRVFEVGGIAVRNATVASCVRCEFVTSRSGRPQPCGAVHVTRGAVARGELVALRRDCSLDVAAAVTVSGEFHAIVVTATRTVINGDTPIAQ